MKRGLWFTALGLYFVLSILRSTKAVMLEYDEDNSTSSASMTVSVHSGEDSDSDSWQSTENTFSTESWCGLGGRGWAGSVDATVECVNATFTIASLAHSRCFLPQLLEYSSIFGVHFGSECLSWPVCDWWPTWPEWPGGAFSSTIDATGTMYWRILPSKWNENERIGMPIILNFGFSVSFDYSCTNVTYETGVHRLQVSVGSETLGPYKSIKCSSPSQEGIPSMEEDSTSLGTFPEQPLKACALIGDTIMLSYHLKADIHTDDPGHQSTFYDLFGPPGMTFFVFGQEPPITDVWFKIVDAKMISPNELGIGIMVMFPEDLPPGMSTESEILGHNKWKGYREGVRCYRVDNTRGVERSRKDC